MRQTTNYGLKITEGNDDWRNIFDDNADNMDAIDAAIAPMTGATVSADGTSGVVPEPESGDQNKFLKGDASWAIPGVMTVNGRSPDASGNITVIEGGGSSSYGSYRLDATIPVSAWTGDGPYVATVSNQYITASMDGTETWLDDETAMLGDTTFTTSDGLLTISTTEKPAAEWGLHVALAVNGADVLVNVTTIRENVDNINNTLGHATALNVSSLSSLKTNLLTLANKADVNGFIGVKIVPSFTSDGFTSGSSYGGYIYNIYKTNGSTTYFSAIVSNNLGEDVLIGYSNGTWYFNSTKKNIDTIITSLNNVTDTVMARNAGAHNGIYRGKYLGTSVTAAQYTAIRNGTFDDLYLGDYWTIGGHDWVICDFDYYIRCGSSNVNQHHLVMMPRTNMNIPAGTALYGMSETLTLLDGETETSKKWNSTSSTNGGYKYSRMRTIIMKAANTIVINAFGSDHVLAFSELYYNPASETDSGLAGNMSYFDDSDQSNIKCSSICDLCNETMVYGQQVWGRGSKYTNVGYEIGIDKFQLAIFSMNRNSVSDRSTWWLRSVWSTSYASVAYLLGEIGTAGVVNALGVRPRFLLVG